VCEGASRSAAGVRGVNGKWDRSVRRSAGRGVGV